MWRIASTCLLSLSANLKSAIEAHGEYITNETLSVSLNFNEPPKDASSVEDDFEGEKVKIGLVKA